MKERQTKTEKTYEMIVWSVSANGYGPTYRELQEMTGYSLANLYDIVQSLQKSGALVTPPKMGRARTIYPTKSQEW